MTWLIITVVSLSFLSSCATPNLKSFAEQTVGLATAVEEERKTTSDQLGVIILGLETAAKLYPATQEDWPKQKKEWLDRKQRYNTSQYQLRNILDQVVAYSGALVDLAEAGEGGKDAVDSIFKTVKEFGSLVPFPGANLATGAVTDILKELGEAWNRAQAQENLRKAMQSVAGENGAAAKVEKAIAMIYSEGQQDLILALDLASQNIALIEHGTARIAFYEKMSAPDRLERYFENAVKILPRATAASGICINSKTATTDPNCVAGEELQSIAALIAITAYLEPNYTAYKARLNQLANWSKLRQAKAKAIVDAVHVWRKEHERLAEILERCGGYFRGFKPSCGNLTAANLKLAIERIKNVIADDADQPAAASASAKERR